jgi:hypothetical protein
VARRVLLTILVVVLLAGCGGGHRRRVAPPVPEPRVVTIVQDDAEFLHYPPARMAPELDDLRALGVTWVRVTAGWSIIAPEPDATRKPKFDASDPDAYAPGAWDRLDRLVRMAQARGLGVDIDIAFWAPRWAVSRGTPDPTRQRYGIDPAMYADFAEAVARRYPTARAFTVWNEPNLSTFWLPEWRRSGGRWVAAAPHDYRAMVQAAVPRIKAAAPHALALIGGLSSLGEAQGHAEDDRIAPLTFLREMACVDRDLKPLDTPDCRDFKPLPGDGWAHHPYSSSLTPWDHDPNPDTARIGDVDRLSTLLDQLHAAGRTANPLPLYITEYGYQTNPPDPTWDVSLADQARWLAEAERIARADPDVRSVAQFLLRDVPPQPGPSPAVRWRDFQSGLRFADGRAKPAHDAYRLPLVARRADDGHVEFWGLVRPGTGVRSAQVEVRGASGWSVLAPVTTAEDGTFTVMVATDPGGTFRLVSGGAAGATLVGAR